MCVKQFRVHVRDVRKLHIIYTCTYYAKIVSITDPLFQNWKSMNGPGEGGREGGKEVYIMRDTQYLYGSLHTKLLQLYMYSKGYSYTEPMALASLVWFVLYELSHAPDT